MDLNIVELTKKLNDVPSMQGLELSSKVSTKKPYFFGDETSKFKVAVLDLGIKTNILRCLSERHCYLKVFPMFRNFGKKSLTELEELIDEKGLHFGFDISIYNLDNE